MELCIPRTYFFARDQAHEYDTWVPDQGIAGGPVTTPRRAMRLVEFEVAGASESFPEYPPLNEFLDYNMEIELSVSPINELGVVTRFGALQGNGWIQFAATTSDPQAVFRASTNIRRGFKRRWSWDAAIAWPRNTVLVARFAVSRPPLTPNFFFDTRWHFEEIRDPADYF